MRPAKVHVLRGLQPICANWKKILDPEGLWHHMEQYVTEHSEAQFSHTICPDCEALLTATSRRLVGDALLIGRPGQLFFAVPAAAVRMLADLANCRALSRCLSSTGIICDAIAFTCGFVP
jgi:hypothetical protein